MAVKVQKNEEKNNHRVRKWSLCVISALVFILGVVVFTNIDVSEAMKIDNVDFGNSGSDGFYSLKTPEQLMALRKSDVVDKFRLENDIEISITDAAVGTFRGILDGNGYQIIVSMDAIKSEDSTTEKEINQGLLFGTIEGTVSNLFIHIKNKTGAADPVSYSFVDTNKTYDKEAANDDTSAFADKIALTPEEVTNGIPMYASGEATKIDELQVIRPESVYSNYYSVTQTGKVTTSTKITKLVKKVNFGVLCGKVDGTDAKVENISITGSGITVSAQGEKYVSEINNETIGERNYYFKEEIEDNKFPFTANKWKSNEAFSSDKDLLEPGVDEIKQEKTNSAITMKYKYDNVLTGDVSYQFDDSTQTKVEKISKVDLYAGLIVGSLKDGSISAVTQRTNLEGTINTISENNIPIEYGKISLGGVAGRLATSQTIRDSYVKGNLSINDANDRALYSVGGVVGTADGSGTILNSIVHNGTTESQLPVGSTYLTSHVLCGVGTTTFVNNYGKESITNATKELTKNNFTGMDNWVYISQDIAREEIFVQKWLCRENAQFSFRSFTEGDARKITTMIKSSDGKEIRDLDNVNKVLFTYKAKRAETIDDEILNSDFTSLTSAIGDDATSYNIGMSGYISYGIAYATDGKYHYFNVLDDFNNPDDEPVTFYPYLNSTTFTHSFDEKLKRDPNTSIDYIMARYMQSTTVSSDIFKYVKDSEPTTLNECNNITQDAKERIANIEFDGTTQKLKGFWVLDGKVYETIESKEFLVTDRESLPAREGVIRWYKGHDDGYYDLTKSDVNHAYPGQYIQLKNNVSTGTTVRYLFSDDETITGDAGFIGATEYEYRKD